MSLLEIPCFILTLPCLSNEMNSFFLGVPSQEIYKDANTQVHTLRKMVKEKEEAIQRQSTLEKKIHELEKQGSIKIQKKGDGDINILPVGMSPAGSEASVGICGGSTANTGSPVALSPLPLIAAESETGKMA